ncbi:MAG: hypothetical protein KDD47_18710, partial [Acidobacteria bacterium]|nr:hypothetical protein [Acidobacteriota bacterium]
MAPNFHSFSKCQRAVVLFVLLAAGSVRFASAAVIPVGSGCTLAQAITAANTDSACGGATGNGADTLVLSGDVSLLSVDNLTDGPNGLPSITSEILIEGGGAVIERSSTLACPQTPTFRLFHVASTGDLTLRDVILRSGCLDESSIVAGGGIYVDGGDLSVVGSTLQGNAIRYVGVSAGSSGGAIYNLGGNVSLADS